jgi:hypothetical protein
MKLQNILWVPAVAIALGMVSLAGPVTARQQAQSSQVSASASQPKAAEAVSTIGDNNEGADAATTGESFATVALFTPGTTDEADAPRQALIGALMAAILMSGTGLIVVYVVAATRRRERHPQPTLQAGAKLRTLA